MSDPVFIHETPEQIYGWVAACHGPSQVEQFQPAFESVNQRLGFADYHLQQVQTLMASATQDLDPLEPLSWLAGVRSASTRKLQEAMACGHAHVLAALQNVHASVDLLAHTVYYGIGMNIKDSTRLKERDICASKVAKRIGLPAIQSAFNAITQHDAYRQVADLTNRSKHRSVVLMPVQIDLLRGTFPELYFEAFEHDSRQYPKQPALPFLRQEHRRIADAAARTIQALIDDLTSRVTTGESPMPT